MPDPLPITEREMLERAARGLGKVDQWGTRGLTMLSNDELEGMVLTLVCMGLVAVRPGEAMPEELVIRREG